MRWLWQVSQHHSPVQAQALPISSEKAYFKKMKEVHKLVVFAKPEMCETQRIMFCGFAVHTKVSQCYISYFLLGSINTHMMISSKTQALVCALSIEHKLLFHTEDAICSNCVNVSESYSITSTTGLLLKEWHPLSKKGGFGSLFSCRNIKIIVQKLLKLLTLFPNKCVKLRKFPGQKSQKTCSTPKE